MADETENAETPDQEPPKKTKRPPQIVYLYGAAADRRNRAARRSRTGRQPRQIRLGRDKKTVVRRNRRIPVTLKWVKENCEELRRHIAAGVIWLEDSNRTRAPEGALKELGLWTDPTSTGRNYPTTSKAAYNDNAPEDSDEETEETEDLTKTPDDEDETGGLEDSEEDDDQDEEGDEPEGEDPEDDEVEEEPQPLPDGYESFAKKELLALFEGRLDVPEDDGRAEPRNAVLIEALAAWEDEHFTSE